MQYLFREATKGDIKQMMIVWNILLKGENNIWALFVHPDHDQQGIGRRLHDLMLHWYFDQTSKNVWLGTAPGTRREIFYRKSGRKLECTETKN